MSIPNIVKKDIIKIVPGISDVGLPMKGGQKIVFPVTIKGKKYVIKFLETALYTDATGEENSGAKIIDEITARAKREVDTMKKCNSPHLVRLGPIPLTSVIYNERLLLYFTEEFIEGEDLKSILRTHRKLSIKDLVILGRDTTKAIRALWECGGKIHRDIKPGNIMRRNADGSFVLLDLGLIFDLSDKSLTITGAIPGTVPYYSPDQLDFARKRQMDFRSDLFTLGIVMYEAATGTHPFMTAGKSVTEIVASIQSYTPPSPLALRKDLPEKLDGIIMRLLAKKPHLRYRTCEELMACFNEIR